MLYIIIFFIILYCIKNNYESFSNVPTISKSTLQSYIFQVYQVNTIALQNLIGVIEQLQINGITIPGNIKYSAINLLNTDALYINRLEKWYDIKSKVIHKWNISNSNDLIFIASNKNGANTINTENNPCGNNTSDCLEIFRLSNNTPNAITNGDMIVNNNTVINNVLTISNNSTFQKDVIVGTLSKQSKLDIIGHVKILDKITTKDSSIKNAEIKKLTSKLCTINGGIRSKTECKSKSIKVYGKSDIGKLSTSTLNMTGNINITGIGSFGSSSVTTPKLTSSDLSSSTITINKTLSTQNMTITNNLNISEINLQNISIMVNPEINTDWTITPSQIFNLGIGIHYHNIIFNNMWCIVNSIVTTKHILQYYTSIDPKAAAWKQVSEKSRYSLKTEAIFSDWTVWKSDR
jgi:hypothetical protein